LVSSVLHSKRALLFLQQQQSFSLRMKKIC
jgi:hypothetical protein